MLKNVVRWNLYGNIIFNRHATIVCDLNIHQRLFSQCFSERQTIVICRPSLEMPLSGRKMSRLKSLSSSFLIIFYRYKYGKWPFFYFSRLKLFDTFSFKNAFIGSRLEEDFPKILFFLVYFFM